MKVKITGRNDGSAYREPFECIIEGERGGYRWSTFKTERERNAFAEGAVIGAAIEAKQHESENATVNA